MASDDSPPGKPPRPCHFILKIAFVALCIGPYLGEFSTPASTPTTRRGSFSSRQLRWVALIVTPFNEHFSPAFHLISWVTWQLSSHRLTWAPWTFTLGLGTFLRDWC